MFGGSGMRRSFAEYQRNRKSSHLPNRTFGLDGAHLLTETLTKRRAYRMPRRVGGLGYGSLTVVRRPSTGPGPQSSATVATAPQDPSGPGTPPHRQG
jgi:hypothetical protein